MPAGVIFKYYHLVLVWHRGSSLFVLSKRVALQFEPVFRLDQLSLLRQVSFKGKEAVKDGGLPHALVSNHHQLGSEEGISTW